MNSYLKKIFLPAQLLLLGLWYATENSVPVTIGEVLLILFIILDKLGKGIVLRETIALHSSFVLLLMPLIGYIYYPISNPLSKLWVKYMPIEEIEYFSFVIPAILLFNLVLCWPIYDKRSTDEGRHFIDKWHLILLQLNSLKVEGNLFIIIGTILYLLVSLLPTSFQYLGFIGFLTAFVGFLMVYFKKRSKNRKLVISYFIVFLSYITLDSGMFTIVVYMGMTIFSFLFLGTKITFWKKAVLFIFGFISIVTIQSVKGSFRQVTWTGDFQDSKAALFGGLLIDEINKGGTNLSDDKLFFFYIRANQGFTVAKVMDYIPQKKDFDDGAYLFKTFISSLVPRLLWPDKPMAGGRVTMKYYADITPEGRTSMNVSPVGEAYGSFGPFLGVLYLMFLAFCIRWVYKYIFLLSNKAPFMIFWIPVLFFQVTYSMETDSLQIFNSVIKSIFFIAFLYYVSPRLFGIVKQHKNAIRLSK